MREQFIMAKRFSPEKDKWGVKISIERKSATIDRRQTRSSAVQRSPRRQVVIQNPRTNGNNAHSERWYKELVNFIGQSKQEVDFQAQYLIESVKRWQHTANKQFDVIQQKIIREHNLESSATSEISIEQSVEGSITRPVAITVKPPKVSKTKPVCFPSMPVLFTEPDSEDDLDEYLRAGPSNPIAPNKVLKRRNTCSAMPSQYDVVPVRKDSRVAHSSVLAIANRPKDVNKALPEPVSTSCLKFSSSGAPKKTSRSSKGRPEPTPKSTSSDNLKRMFLETQKIIMERQRQKQSEQEAAAQSNGHRTNESNNQSKHLP